MSDRDTIITGFLERVGWGDATRHMLAGDASNRRYERLDLRGQPAVLMDAPTDKNENVGPFVELARHLCGIGLSAPRVFAEDRKNGLLLIEDLGDDLYSSVLRRDPLAEQPLYLAATDALIALHSANHPEHAPDYGPAKMVETAGLASDWYAYGATGRRSAAGKAAIANALSNAFACLAPWSPVLVLRDYHAENLIWLPDRAPSHAKVGLLDFQDAGLGHPAYDLMSLAHDVRREVAPETRAAMISRYAEARNLDRVDFEQACATVSAQRNLRILGVFARLSMHFGKPRYVDLIPTVWSNLLGDVSHESLADLDRTVRMHLPEPTEAILNELRAKCATVPTL